MMDLNLKLFVNYLIILCEFLVNDIIDFRRIDEYY